MSDTNSLMAEAHLRVAAEYIRAGRLADAEAVYRTVLNQVPDCAPALHNLGVIALGTGRFTESADHLRRAVELVPHDASAQGNLGLALIRLGRADEAASFLREAVRLDANNATWLYNFGTLLLDLGALEEAAEVLRRSVALRAGHAQSHNSLGAVLMAQNRNEMALACFDQAIACDPMLAGAYDNKGQALTRLGRLEEAEAAFTRAETLAPGSAAFRLAFARAQLCDWSHYDEDIAAVARSVNGGGEEVQPFALLNLSADPLAHLEAAKRWADCWTAYLPKTDVVPRESKRSKLRIGYLSGDYRRHAVASLIAELIERHDRSRFEIIAYSIGPDDGGPMRRRLVGSFDRFVDLIDVAHEDAAKRIEADGIDILVDLAGYTELGRTQILARRPAPIQANYLGYPGTMGASFVDYIIADPIIAPLSHQPFYAEKIVQLPHCYQPNDTKREVDAKMPSRAECGLPEIGFVFCCLNGSAKIARPVFDAWMGLLSKVEGSVLWLLDGGEAIRRNLRLEAKRLGIAPDRLVFAAKLPADQHLARMQLADLFLDTMPYNAHTTASEALWMGVPVVTMLGQAFPGRVAASLLAATGLAELAAPSFDGYVALALALAQDADRLATIRRYLVDGRANFPLFDIVGFTRHIEAAYQEMWRIFERGEAPRSFAVPTT